MFEQKVFIRNGDERVGGYVRISQKDRTKLTPNQLSASIENQITMLKDYCDNNKWNLVNIYCDEDISGADQTRPEFNKLIKDCESGKINVVLCKAQDRFARDMEMIEKYVHNKFIEWGVRFITIVDHADNAVMENKKNRQITGLTNEWLLEDMSNNIRTTLNSKRKNGDFVSSFAPYGYKKIRDSRKKIHLVIDPVAAEVVKKIFNDFNSGNSIRSIARDLNERCILSPSEYKKKNGENIHIPTKIINSNKFENSSAYILKYNYFSDNLKINTKVHLFCKVDVSSPELVKNIELKVFGGNQSKIYYTKYDFNTDNILEAKKQYKKWIKLEDSNEIPSNVKYIRVDFNVNKLYEELSIEFELKINKNINRDYVSISHISYIKNELMEKHFQLNARYKSKWKKEKVREIIKDLVYIGTLAQGKRTTISYKNKKVVNMPKSQWIIVPNVHEPIVSKKTYLKAQERLNSLSKSVSTPEVNMFSGILKCGYCGRNFRATKCGRAGDKNQVSYFICADRSEKFINCKNRTQLRQDTLKELTLNEINKIIKNLKEDSTLSKFYQDNVEHHSGIDDKYNALVLENERLIKEKEKKNHYSKGLYENKINGFIDEEEFVTYKQSYKDEIKKIEERQLKIIEEQEALKLKKEDIKNIKEIVKKYDTLTELNYDVIHELISEITIGVKEEGKPRKISFKWNF